MMSSRPRHSAATRLGAVAPGVIAAMALALQYVLLIRLADDGFALATLRFLSYFTILSNLLVLCVAIAVVAKPVTTFFARLHVIGGVVLYISITGLVYITVLQQLWQPQGLQWWADVGLHYATPIACLGWWLACVPHGVLRWRHIAQWLLFPLAYLAWTLVRGAWLSEYPYPFIDVGALGFVQAMRNAAGVCIAFAVVGAVLVGLDKGLGRVSRRVQGAD